MKTTRRYLPASSAACEVLGTLVASGRRERGWTSADLAERLGVHVQTLRRIEHGDPSVAVGLIFEAALVCGVDLFSVPPAELARLAADTRTRLALLPTRVRAKRTAIDDDF